LQGNGYQIAHQHGIKVEGVKKEKDTKKSGLRWNKKRGKVGYYFVRWGS